MARQHSCGATEQTATTDEDSTTANYPEFGVKLLRPRARSDDAGAVNVVGAARYLRAIAADAEKGGACEGDAETSGRGT